MPSPMTRERTLSREVSATQIPSGDRHALPAGTSIQIHQTLGGSYTVQTDHGLFRIDGKDGDAFGEQAADHTVDAATRSEEHTSELQSLRHLVCRLLLEK